MTSRQVKSNENTNFKILRFLHDNPDVTQREIAEKLGMSIGRLNFCLKALIDKGFVKMGNFQKSKNKFKYVYLLTPKSFAEKVALTSRFLQSKMEEYEILRLEIESLKLKNKIHCIKELTHMSKEKKIAIIGLGYVGLPLAVEFGKLMPVIAFDINEIRVKELQSGMDHTLECTKSDLLNATKLQFTSNQQELSDAEIFIVTVPTPVDKANRPDLNPLIKASQTVGKYLKPEDIVIFESTVYPGATEEVCVPVLEHVSGLKFNKDFYCGYSPERINPGDKEHRLHSIKKVTSGSTTATAEEIDKLYQRIISAGTYKASSIRVAEAAKVIENTQRDLNIALMNELSMIFNKLGIDTLEVLDAAATKWNFLPFRPGLVGGHCIGVDPYYLTHKAQEVGYHSEVILAGRRINDSMAGHVADETIKLMLRKNLPVLGSNVLVLGLAFKENCPDVRNTKVVDIVKALLDYNTTVDIYDPWIDIDEAEKEYGLQCLSHEPELGKYAAIILAVGHHQFMSLGEHGIKAMGQPGAVIYDVKSILPLGSADGRL